MSKNLIFCFDGTSNQPGDAVQDVSRRTGAIEDDNVTNIFKLHLLFGGDLEDGRVFDDQLSLYYSGVGTHGKKIKRIFNAALAPSNGDVGRIIKDGIKDLRTHYENGDQLFVFGFSRGAAIARIFASRLPVYFEDNPPRVRFLGVFDTVASMDGPNLERSDKPVSDVVFENGTISPGIDEALHLVSMDDKRIAFMPTLMNQDKRVTEIWMPGAHSDVGGGFRYDGLSDLALHMMLEEFERRGLGLKLLAPHEIDFERVSSDEDNFRIDLDDILIQPSHLGLSHEQHRPPITSLITLNPRQLRVNVDDQASPIPPLVHHAVIDRIHDDPDYRPESLKLSPHLVCYPNTEPVNADGLRDHLVRGRFPGIDLAVGDTRTVTVHARLKFSPTGFRVEAGQEYLIQVDETQRWVDGGIPCGPDGWTRAQVELGPKEFFIWAKESDRRVPEANWYELIATMGRDDPNPVRVLQYARDKLPIRASRSGELFFYANDLDSRYGNNMGAIKVLIQRTA